MTKTDLMSIERWADKLEDLDREIARLALLCAVPVLDPGAVERVLRKDASVCGVDNPAAFRRLHGLVNLYFVIRPALGESIGELQAAELERHVVNRLRKTFPGLADGSSLTESRRFADDSPHDES